MKDFGSLGVAVTNDQGTLISQQRYLPFGGVRTNIGSIVQTDYGYTGQRNLDEDIGLMDYKARFYSPVLNRFIQPDSIVPHPYNSQSYNRYSYVYNNPINFNDPTGHLLCDADGYCNQQSSINQRNSNGRCVGKCPSPKPKPREEEVLHCQSSMCNPNPTNPFIGSSSGSGSSGSTTSSGSPSIPEPSINISYSEDDLCLGHNVVYEICAYGGVQATVPGNIPITVSPQNNGVSIEGLSLTPTSISSGPISLNTESGTGTLWLQVFSATINSTNASLSSSTQVGLTYNGNGNFTVNAESSSALTTDIGINYTSTFGVSVTENPVLLLAGIAITGATVAIGYALFSSGPVGWITTGAVASRVIR